MPISFHCTTCALAVKVPDEAEGLAFACPRCREKLRVPRGDKILDAVLIDAAIPEVLEVEETRPARRGRDGDRRGAWPPAWLVVMVIVAGLIIIGIGRNWQAGAARPESEAKLKTDNDFLARFGRPSRVHEPEDVDVYIRLFDYRRQDIRVVFVKMESGRWVFRRFLKISDGDPVNAADAISLLEDRKWERP